MRIYLQVYFITVDIAFVTAVKEKKSTNHLTVAILLNELYLKPSRTKITIPQRTDFEDSVPKISTHIQLLEFPY